MPTASPRHSSPAASRLALLALVACQSDKGVSVFHPDPAVSITVPLDGEEFEQGELVTFEGYVSNDDGGVADLTLDWSSSQDGLLNADPPDADGATRFAVADLSPGAHVVTLRAVNAHAKTGEDYVSIVVNEVEQEPEITIRHPVGAEYGVEGVEFGFEALVRDEQDEAPDLVVWFESDLDGIFCEPVPDDDGLAGCDAALSPGDHVITMGVEDSSGNDAAAEVAFFVFDGDQFDDDSDGYTEEQDDCDDTDPSVHPGATEYANGADDDCDGEIDEGTVDVDDDGDGFTESAGDCDDGDPNSYPGAIEVCDGIDNDCDLAIDDGTSCVDDDGDGLTELDGDCDDAAATVYPGAAEYADGVDNDCDGIADEGTSAYDDDGDCYCETATCTGSVETGCASLSDGDCDDADDSVNPSAAEVCDGSDDNCDGTVDEDTAVDAATWYADADGDAWGDASSPAIACDAPSGYVANDDDCDDGESGVNPGESETCDGVDEDCDGSTDEGVTPTWYADADGDGYGDAGKSKDACTEPAGYVADDTDCDDTDATLNPATVWYRDADSDGYGDASVTKTQCAQPSGYVSDDTDCNDTTASANPSETETCDLVDNDCDGSVDEASATDASTWYVDSDGDGYGTTASTKKACSQPAGYSAVSTDCDDTAASVSPAGTESCNSVDDDCDGTVDDGVTTTYYRDADGDGYGDASTTSAACSAPSGYVSNRTDCDDTDASLSPATVWYRDADSDGYGNASVTKTQCAQPSGYVSDDTDCNDTTASANPGEPESCSDLVDNDCDGTVDEATASDAVTWYLDADGDGYGVSTSTKTSCSKPSGYSSVSTDCDDTDSSVSPGATETCNGTDDDCDSSTDEGVTTTYYRDSDGDGYGDASKTSSGCSAPSGYVSNKTDCDDTDASLNPTTVWYRDLDSDGYGDASVTKTQCATPTGYVSNDDDCNDSTSAANPGATEYCDLVDNDCDGSTDEASAADASTWYKDGDGDGYGTSATSQKACSKPTGYVAVPTDCDDSSAAVSPAATETCNSVDDDCDSSIDEGVESTWYADDDGDGYGDPSVSTEACSAPSGYVSDDSDCDDTDATLSPETEWYRDYDSDGYGDASVTKYQCTEPTGYVDDDTDCDDTTSSANPGRTESCDSIDNDCDGSTDEINATGCQSYYPDYDGDGYGRSSGTARCYCSGTGTYTSTNNTDCYDYNANANPGATAYYSSDRGDGSYDYNCDSTQSKRYTDNYTCTGAVYVCIDYDAGWTSSSDPSCGSTGTWGTGCSADLTSCSYSSSSSKTQTCR